jgi:hypothetical protein
MLNYKMFLPAGAREDGETVVLASGMSFPRYAFIAVPIVGLKGSSGSDLLSNVQTNPVYYDTRTNSFTFTKKVRNVTSPSNRKDVSSLSTSDEEAFVKFNFDGYVNISQLITNIKSTIRSVKEQQKGLVAFEQDVGYASVRSSSTVDYTIVSIEPDDDYASVDYPLSPHLTLRDLLVYRLRPQTLLSQVGLSKKIIVKNLMNLAVNVYEPVVKYLLDGDDSKVQVFSGFTEQVYYAPDAESYMGEAITLSFPGFTPSSVYLVAKDMINSLYFNELYLDYFLDDAPRITVILNASSQNYIFGTRFENNLIHPSRLVNVDRDFSTSQDDGVVQTDGSLNLNVTIAPVSVSRDVTLLQDFLTYGIEHGYVQSEENAIKLAYSANLNISGVTTSVLPEVDASTQEVKADYFDTPADYDVDYDAPTTASDDLNSALSLLLPSLIKCPTVTNGSVDGYPNQEVFPMTSDVGYRPVTDVSMLNNPSNVSGEFGLPQSIRLNNPLLVAVVDGVTNKPEDGYVGQVGGKAAYAHRLGGLIAGLRQMQTTAPTGKTILGAASSMVPAGLLTKLVANLSKAIFNVVDPTGSMLSCAQVDMDNGNVNDNVVMVAMMLATLSNSKKSPFTFEEITAALSHIKGDSQFTKTVDGQAVGTPRDLTKELPLGSTKTENTANSTPMQMANTLINGTKAVIVDGKGADSETKTQRLSDQDTTYEKYDVGADHSDRMDQIGAYVVSTLLGQKDKIF